MCPHCSGNTFVNHWGLGNAICVNCNREVIIHFTTGKLQVDMVPGDDGTATVAQFPIALFQASDIWDN